MLVSLTVRCDGLTVAIVAGVLALLLVVGVGILFRQQIIRQEKMALELEALAREAEAEAKSQPAASGCTPC